MIQKSRKVIDKFKLEGNKRERNILRHKYPQICRNSSPIYDMLITLKASSVLMTSTRFMAKDKIETVQQNKTLAKRYSSGSTPTLGRTNHRILPSTNSAQPAQKSTRILINSVEDELKVQWAGTMYKLEAYRVRPRWGSQGDKVAQS